MSDHYQLLGAIIADAAFWVGLATIAVFAAGRFNERRIDTERDLDPPISAGCFTGRFRFSSALLMYVLAYLLFYGLLIFSFSFELFQEFFKEFFGPISITVEGDPQSREVGTPAWIATLIPILTSSTPWFRRRDADFRRWLWEFSGVPLTAQAFANELVSVAGQRLPPLRPDKLISLSVQESLVVHDVLGRISDRLAERSERYKEFVREHEAIGKSVVDTFEMLRQSATSDLSLATKIAESREVFLAAVDHAQAAGEAPTRNAAIEIREALLAVQALLDDDGREGDKPEQLKAPAARSPLKQALQNLIVRKSRLIACGALSARHADFAARETINDVVGELLASGEMSTAGMAGRKEPFRMRMPRFRFGYIQLMAGFAAVLAVTIMFGAVREILLPAFQDGKAIGREIWEWIVFSPFVAAAFVLPLVPAAALRYFLTDIEDRRTQPLTFEHYLMAIAVNVVASMALAAIVLLGLGVLFLRRWMPEFELLHMIPWALPMATASTLFLLLSRVRFTASPHRNRVIDAAIFGVGGAFAAAISTAAGMMLRGRITTADELTQVLDLRSLTLIGVLAGIGAVVGLTQCQSSRRGLVGAPERRVARPEVWAAPPTMRWMPGLSLRRRARREGSRVEALPRAPAAPRRTSSAP